MRNLYIRMLLCSLLSICLAGCGKSVESKRQEEIQKLAKAVQLNKMVGDYAEVFSSDSVLVEGYGIVMGLNGKGSSECPPAVREKLIKFIQQKLDTDSRNVAINFLKSRDNAVVRVYGLTPSGSGKGSRFDVAVEALPGTQTTSLEGGVLYECELVVFTRVGVAGAKIIAKAQGPLYINDINSKNNSKTKGTVIGGGVALETPAMTVGLFEPNYLLTNLIRNRINQRFEENTAEAKGPGLIVINPPREYKHNQKKLASLIRYLYLPQNDVSEQKKIEELAAGLNDTSSSIDNELALEAIGRKSVRTLSRYLDDPDEYVRLRAARCMLNLGETRSISVLTEIARDPKSIYRTDAIKAIGVADRDLVKTSLRRFLDDYNFDVRLAAYTELKKTNDIDVRTEIIGGSFMLDKVFSKTRNTIYVKRKRMPGILLIGKDFNVIDNIFLTSRDGKITLSSSEGQESVSIMRKHPTRPGIVGPIKTSSNLENILRALGESPVKSEIVFKQGLGVSFSEIVSILNQMVESGAIKADFIAEPMEDIDELISTARGLQ